MLLMLGQGVPTEILHTASLEGLAASCQTRKSMYGLMCVEYKIFDSYTHTHTQKKKHKSHVHLRTNMKNACSFMYI